MVGAAKATKLLTQTRLSRHRHRCVETRAPSDFSQNSPGSASHCGTPTHHLAGVALTSSSVADQCCSYLHTWTELYQPQFINRNAFPTHDHSMPAPAACHDTGLAAFAQLAALRIGVRRAFVTIMSRETEYVLVEATRTMSLQSDFTADGRDRNWLGTSCFDRADGINDKALDSWRRARQYRDIPESSQHYYTEGISPHWCIVSDASISSEFQQRPFVARAEAPRFFFSVPLRDGDGAVIGSVSMLDDKPRYGVSADEMLFCEDLSDTIAQHLLGSMIATQRQRSEWLIQALGTFNDGGKSLKDWWIGQDKASMQRGGRRRDAVQTDEQKGARFEREFGARESNNFDGSREQSRSRAEQPLPSASQIQPRMPRSASDGNTLASEDRIKNNASGVDFQTDSTQETQERMNGSEGQQQASRKRTRSRSSSPPKGRSKSQTASKQFDAAAQIKDAYDRASNLLREATGAHGIAFLDASAASAARPLDPSCLQSTRHDDVKGSGTTTPSLTTSSDDDSKATSNSDTELSDSNEQRSKLSKVVGRSVQAQNTGHDAGGSMPLRLNQRDMARLMKSYPSGKVFNYALSGTPYSGSEESADSGAASSESATDVNPRAPRANTKYNRHAQMLLKAIGDARSIAFYPIWDSTNNRFRSCLFAWTLHANRFFDTKEDITYLSAFGHSLRAEISRIETVASDVAKGKFISSVSHELR